ncbi:hypothetical protein CspeluHIS016_0110770 [Cutaneotrichosporon spelunceum]|uniref:Uncharacterized protein n=1 Tax=Cutaneotrichosporon spelunceum TaxID=1672016 RepID=A0AAD3TP79_9TREE|nr:hypothetical protein CspeluHIS016_0110770 [Cutaneotrichosporon spelunceum]
MIPYPLNGDIRSSADLTSLYRQYLRVLNNRTFDLLSRFVARRCMHNGHRMSSHEYSQLIKSGATFCADEIVADVSQRTIAAPQLGFLGPRRLARFAPNITTDSGV